MKLEPATGDPGRRNWKATLISDGMVFLRHPDLGTLEEMADTFATKLQMFAG